MIASLFRKIVKKNIPRWIVLLIDIYIVANTFIVSYLIRFNFSLNFDFTKLGFQLPFVVIASLISFLFIGSYKGIIRHTGLRDALNVFFASFVILIILTGVVYLNQFYGVVSKLAIPKSIIAIHFLLNITILITSRFIFKELYYFVIAGYGSDKRILIYGAGEAGMLVYSILKDDKKNKSQIIGFIDDNNKKVGKKINGLKVYDSKIVNRDFIESKGINEIVISIQNIQSSRLLEIVDKLSKIPAKVKIVPPVNTWIDGSLNSSQIKPVMIEDLLGREPINILNPVLEKEFNNKVILVTGAAGSIGSEISKQLSKFKYQQLVLIDQAESDLYNLQQALNHIYVENFEAIVGDVRNKKRMEFIVQKYKPSIIFHAAAYKHVPFMESNPNEAVYTNICGTKVMADLALNYGAKKFVMISTDKAVNPTNIMGATKRISEMYINCLSEEQKTKFITTRFGNVLGSNGSVIPLFQSQIKKGGPLTVTHEDITRYFMTIPEACQLVLEAGCMGYGGEIFVFDMGESIKIFDLALNMIHLSGLKFPSDIDIKITGLRPGEKIYEELLANGENTTATYNDKIMIAKVKKVDSLSTKKQIEELCILNKELDYQQTVKKMKEIVPEFISNNSEYELLDL